MFFKAVTKGSDTMAKSANRKPRAKKKEKPAFSAPLVSRPRERTIHELRREQFESLLTGIETGARPIVESNGLVYPFITPDDAKPNVRAAASIMLHLTTIRQILRATPRDELRQRSKGGKVGILAAERREENLLAMLLPAFLMGANAESLDLTPLIAAGESKLDSLQKANKGKATLAAARQKRWIEAARIIRGAEPNISQRMVAVRIAKQEKQRKLHDACAWRAVNDAIRSIF